MPSYREAQWKTGNETDDDGGKLRPKSMEHTAGSSKAPTPPPKLPFNGQNATVKADSGKGSVPPSNIPAVERDVLKGEGVRREASSRDLKEVDSRIVRDEKEVHETNDDEDSEIVMSSTAYPGQEWMPWIGDVD